MIRDWQEQFKKRFVVLPDTAFDFLCETGTEVQTRVRIDDETKTVADKALWTEESLPAETILAGIVRCDRIFGRNGEDITPAGLLDRFARALAHPPNRRQGDGGPGSDALRFHDGERRWPMSIHTRSQKLAQAAYGRIALHTNNGKKQPDKEYVSFAKKFPASDPHLRIGPGVAFALAKKETGLCRRPRRSAERPSGHPEISGTRTLDHHIRTATIERLSPT